MFSRADSGTAGCIRSRAAPVWLRGCAAVVLFVVSLHASSAAALQASSAIDPVTDQLRSRTAFFSAFTVALREGLEIAWLIVALLALVRKRGQPRLTKYVHAGWLLAVPAGFATYALINVLLRGLTDELAEGVTSLVAAAMMLGVTHWLMAQLGTARWAQRLSRRVAAALAGSRAAIAVLSLSFFAAYREAFENVMVFQALIRDAGDAAHVVGIGAVCGVGMLHVLALLLGSLGQHLRPAPFMWASSVWMAILSFVLVGNGVHALQEAGVVPWTSLAWPDLPLLGLYPAVETLSAQALVVLGLVAMALWTRHTAELSDEAALHASDAASQS
jgi:high-affinity iron transporter